MLVVYLIVALLCGAICTSIYQSKGRPGSSGFLLGFLFGPLGVLIAAVLSADTRHLEEVELRQGSRKKCPDCAESVMKEARKCKHCGYQFVQPSKAPDRARVTGDFDRAVAARRMFKP
jgi:ribosomal protein L37AE/L43A